MTDPLQRVGAVRLPGMGPGEGTPLVPGLSGRPPKSSPPEVGVGSVRHVPVLSRSAKSFRNAQQSVRDAQQSVRAVDPGTRGESLKMLASAGLFAMLIAGVPLLIMGAASLPVFALAYYLKHQGSKDQSYREHQEEGNRKIAEGRELIIKGHTELGNKLIQDGLQKKKRGRDKRVQKWFTRSTLGLTAVVGGLKAAKALGVAAISVSLTLVSSFVTLVVGGAFSLYKVRKKGKIIKEKKKELELEVDETKRKEIEQAIRKAERRRRYYGAGAVAALSAGIWLACKILVGAGIVGGLALTGVGVAALAILALYGGYLIYKDVKARKIAKEV